MSADISDIDEEEDYYSRGKKPFESFDDLIDYVEKVYDTKEENEKAHKDSVRIRDENRGIKDSNELNLAKNDVRHQPRCCDSIKEDMKKGAIRVLFDKEDDCYHVWLTDHDGYITYSLARCPYCGDETFGGLNQTKESVRR